MYNSSSVQPTTVSLSEFLQTWARKRELSDFGTVSLRMPIDEAQYQHDKQYGLTMELDKMPAMAESEYWKIVPNTYPYSMVMRDQVLIVTKEKCGDWDLLSDAAKAEYYEKIRPLLRQAYDIIFENSDHRRSVPGIYHLHAANIKLNETIRVPKHRS